QLELLLPDHGRDDIERAFSTEADFYRQHAYEAHDEASLATLRERCVRVFNDALGSSLSSEEYVAALQFQQLPGVTGALDPLRALGLGSGVVANGAGTLKARLPEAAVTRFVPAVVPAANKPAPEGILRALELLRLDPSRALPIGDEAGDEEAARA